MLTGSYEYILDQKRRVSLPKAMRLEFGESVYIAPGFKKHTLSIFPIDSLEKIRGKVEALPLSQSIPLSRKIFPRAQKVQIDGQGRVLVPGELLDKAGMKVDDKVMIIGLASFAELWPYDLYMAELCPDENEGLMEALEEVEI